MNYMDKYYVARIYGLNQMMASHWWGDKAVTKYYYKYEAPGKS